MPFPVYHGAGAFAFGTGDLYPGLPSGITPGMILILIIETEGSEPVTVGNWTHAPDSPVNNVSGTHLSVYWRRATADASDNAFIEEVSDHVAARIVAFTNCVESGTPFDVTAAATGSGTAVTAAGDTTTVNDCLVLIAASRGNDLTGARFSGWANADLTEITELIDAGTSVGTGGGIALVTGKRAAAGAVGSTSAVLDQTAPWAAWTGALLGPAGSEESEEESSEESEEESSEESEESEEDNEVDLGIIRMDTWEFDSPEPVVGDRDPVTGYVTYQYMDNGAENRDKKISAIRVTARGSDINVQIHAASPGEEIGRNDIETGTNARATVTFADSNEVTRYAEKKVNIRNLSIWTARFEMTWDGAGERSRLDELVISGDTHGTRR